MGKLYAMHLASAFFTSTAFAFEPKAEDFPFAAPPLIKRLLAERSLKSSEDNYRVLNGRSGSDVDYFVDSKFSKRSLLTPEATVRQLAAKTKSYTGMAIEIVLGIGNFIVLGLQFHTDLKSESMAVDMYNLLLNFASSSGSLIANSKKGVDWTAQIVGTGSLLYVSSAAILKMYREMKDDIKSILIYSGIFALIAAASGGLLMIPREFYLDYLGGVGIMALYVLSIAMGRIASLLMITKSFREGEPSNLSYTSLGAKIAGNVAGIVAQAVKTTKQLPLIIDQSIGLILNLISTIQRWYYSLE